MTKKFAIKYFSILETRMKPDKAKKVEGKFDSEFGSFGGRIHGLLKS